MQPPFIRNIEPLQLRKPGRRKVADQKRTAGMGHVKFRVIVTSV